MPKEKFGVQIGSGTAGRRVRGLSREIFFALALTVAAIASLLGVANRDAAKTVSIASGHAGTNSQKPDNPEPAKTSIAR
ncbi:MAG: hypothetical protein ABL894_13870 [Hyphomicrobium sp.]